MVTPAEAKITGKNRMELTEKQTTDAIDGRCRYGGQ